MSEDQAARAREKYVQALSNAWAVYEKKKREAFAQRRRAEKLAEAEYKVDLGVLRIPTCQ